MTRRHFAAMLTAAAQAAPARTTMGLASDSLAIRRVADPLELMDLATRLHMGGAQVRLASADTAIAGKLRARAEKWNLWLTVACPVPGEDTTQFERIVKIAREAGALSLRVAAGGRRYEVFDTLEERRAQVSGLVRRLRKAVPILEAARMPLGLENHKDWTLEEQVKLFQEFSSEYFGACIDTGNSIALLEDPMEVVEQLSPYAHTAHLKDMAVQEYEEGFLLSEVPLGEGFLDLKRMLATMLKHRPKLPIALEMITRDPLKIPCLTRKYWATFPDRNGWLLARTLAMVRANKPARPLPRVTGLSREAALKLEMDYIQRSVAHARDHLGLV